MKLENIIVSFKPDTDDIKISDILGIFQSLRISVSYLDSLFSSGESFEGKFDVVFVFGGDGSVLRTVEKLLKFKHIPPVVGVNLGKVGFLTFGEDSLEKIISLLKEDKFFEDRKRLMYCEGVGYALNDFVLKSPHLCEFEIKVNPFGVGYVRADGVIISSQTGSTAYNLSVGGPIVLPGVDIFVISFIAPFSVFSRPAVVGPDRKIIIKSSHECELYSDGKFVGKTKEVLISYSQRSVRILRSLSFNFFDVIKKKLF